MSNNKYPIWMYRMCDDTDETDKTNKIDEIDKARGFWDIGGRASSYRQARFSAFKYSTKLLLGQGRILPNHFSKATLILVKKFELRTKSLQSLNVLYSVAIIQISALLVNGSTQ